MRSLSACVCACVHAFVAILMGKILGRENVGKNLEIKRGGLECIEREEYLKTG